MTDLNKLRSEFEELPEVKQWIERLIYGDNSEVYIMVDETEENNAIATWINGAWFVWKLKANAQAVPEGFCLVPKEIPDNVVSCLENSGYHWGDMTRDHYAPIYSLMVEVASESGVLE